MLRNVTVQWLKIKIESVGCAERKPLSLFCCPVGDKDKERPNLLNRRVNVEIEEDDLTKEPQSGTSE